jgi:hypothetical protein
MRVNVTIVMLLRLIGSNLENKAVNILKHLPLQVWIQAFVMQEGR